MQIQKLINYHQTQAKEWDLYVCFTGLFIIEFFGGYEYSRFT